jgi:hypothetical protein
MTVTTSDPTSNEPSADAPPAFVHGLRAVGGLLFAIGSAITAVTGLVVACAQL